MIDNEFTTWLEEEIKERYWTYNELGRQAGLSSATISLVMTGRRNPGPDFCTGVAKALGLPPELVFRKAGILPPAQENDDDYWQELRHYLRQLSIRDRIRVIQMVRGWAAEAELEEGGALSEQETQTEGQ